MRENTMMELIAQFSDGRVVRSSYTPYLPTALEAFEDHAPRGRDHAGVVALYLLSARPVYGTKRNVLHGWSADRGYFQNEPEPDLPDQLDMGTGADEGPRLQDLR